MIVNKKLAGHINALMLDVSGRIDESILMVQEHCSFEEFENYRRACSKILTGIVLEILNPIHQLHSELMPEGRKPKEK